MICNGLFVSNRTLDQIYDQELKLDRMPVLPPSEVQIDLKRRAVAVGGESNFPAPAMRAAYREGLGCVVLSPDQDFADIDSLPELRLPPAPGDAATIPWPEGDLVSAKPLPPGVEAKALDTAWDWALDRQTHGHPLADHAEPPGGPPGRHRVRALRAGSRGEDEDAHLVHRQEHRQRARGNRGVPGEARPRCAAAVSRGRSPAERDPAPRAPHVQRARPRRQPEMRGRRLVPELLRRSELRRGRSRPRAGEPAGHPMGLRELRHAPGGSRAEDLARREGLPRLSAGGAPRPDRHAQYPARRRPLRRLRPQQPGLHERARSGALRPAFPEPREVAPPRRRERHPRVLGRLLTHARHPRPREGAGSTGASGGSYPTTVRTFPPTPTPPRETVGSTRSSCRPTIWSSCGGGSTGCPAITRSPGGT